MLVVEPYPDGNCTNGIPHMPPSLLTFDPLGNVTLTAAMFYSGHPFKIDFTCEVEEPCEDLKSSKYCKKQEKKGKCKKSSVWKKCKETCDKC